MDLRNRQTMLNSQSNLKDPAKNPPGRYGVRREGEPGKFPRFHLTVGQ